ncbi:MAG: hypothetical protein ACYTG2_07975 [Planctomycetota bacterium]
MTLPACKPFVVLGLALLAAACGTTPEPGPPTLGTALIASLRHFASAPLLAQSQGGGMPSTALSDDPADALCVSAVVRVVQRRPDTGLTAFADAAELIAAVEEAAPIRTVAGPTRGTLFAVGSAAAALGPAVEGGEFGARRIVNTLSGALPVGATVSIDTQRVLPAAFTPDALPIRAGAFVQLHRPGGAAGSAPLELAVAVVTESLQREIALVQLPAGFEAGSVAVVVPWPVTTRSGAALVVSLEVLAAPRPGTPAAREHARTLARCLEEVSQDALPPSPTEGLPRGLVSALQGLLEATPPRSDPETDAAPDTVGQRGTLLYLSELVGAELAQDIALSAEPALVDALARAMLASGSEQASIGETPEGIGAVLERLAFQMLLDDSGLDEPPPEHEALLILHAGEVGRSGALLAGLLADQPALDTLATRITAENIAFLQHSSPASRVRAFDWLRKRHLAPDGYDPLATRDERRAALRAAGLLEGS